MKWSVMLLLLCCSTIALSQEKKPLSKPDYSKEPVWIKMIDDPNVNYYEAVEAFETYWKGKVEPEEESELINEGKITPEEAERMQAERETWTQEQRNEYNQMKYQFKRFKQWKRDVYPYVQNDGRILTEQERLNIYNQQREGK